MTGPDPLPAEVRSSVYGLLATFWGRPLSTEMLERFAAEASVGAGDAGGFAAELLTPLRALGGPEVTMRLAAEHTRLFGGVQDGYGPAPPYESVWREGRVMGEATVAVASSYQAAGYAERAVAGPCDHLAEELRFVAALSAAEATAARDGANDKADQARAHQRRFFDEHLLAWVPAYCRDLAGQAREPLYAALARVTEQVLLQDSKGFAMSVDRARDAPACCQGVSMHAVPGDGTCRMQ